MSVNWPPEQRESPQLTGQGRSPKGRNRDVAQHVDIRIRHTNSVCGTLAQMTSAGPSEFAWLLKRHGITEDMQRAARAALNNRSREDHRTAIAVAGVLAVGAYVVMKVAGLGSNLYSAIAIGAGLVVSSRLFSRSQMFVSRSIVNDLIEHTRTQVDFGLLASDIHALDPAVADDLRPVLTLGMQSPSELSRYSILHLWELLRKQAESEQT